MSKIKCLVVEDEPLAMNRLLRFIEKSNAYLVQKTCVSTDELKLALNSYNPDLLFLDIQLAGDNSLHFIKDLKVDIPIIFTTAYDEYALQSFDLNVIDYLLKPFDFERFEKATEKVKKHLSINFEVEGSIIVSSEHAKIKLNFSEIIYIESMKDYVKIFCEGRPKPILIRQNLKTFSAQLPQNDFKRVHKSYVIAVSKIVKIGSSSLFLGQIEIPIGNNYKKEFMENYLTI